MAAAAGAVDARVVRFRGPAADSELGEKLLDVLVICTEYQRNRLLAQYTCGTSDGDEQRVRELLAAGANICATQNPLGGGNILHFVCNGRIDNALHSKLDRAGILNALLEWCGTATLRAKL